MASPPGTRITAFIARKVHYGESDLILTLLSREEGRIDAIARGARKSRKRFEAGLSYYMMYEGTVSKRRESSLWFLQELTVVQMYPTLLDDYTKLSSAAYGTELAREMAPPHQEDEPLFTLLTTFYENLDASPSAPHLIPWLQYNMLAWSGYIPHAHECNSCHREGSPDRLWTLSPMDGALLCATCAPAHMRRQPWANFQWLFTHPPPEPDPSVAQELRPILTRLVTKTLGKSLKSGTLL